MAEAGLKAKSVQRVYFDADLPGAGSPYRPVFQIDGESGGRWYLTPAGDLMREGGSDARGVIGRTARYFGKVR